METTINTNISKKVLLIMGILTAIFIGMTNTAIADNRDSTSIESNDYQENYELLKGYFDNQQLDDTTERVVIYDNDHNIVLDITIENERIEEATSIMIQHSDLIMQEGTTRYFIMN